MEMVIFAVTSFLNGPLPGVGHIDPLMTATSKKPNGGIGLRGCVRG